MLLIRFLWNRWFAREISQVEAESLAYRNSPDGQRFDGKTVTVLVTVALCLTMQQYLGGPSELAMILRHGTQLIGQEPAIDDFAGTLERMGASQHTRLTWWAVVAVVSYVVLPSLVIRAIFRERIRDYGVKLKGASAGLPVYLVFVVVMVPLVWICSAEARFQATYPFYRIYSATEIDRYFWQWEALYALQFVALEFFFRGFIVHGTKHRFGAYSVAVMMVPYCMIHFAKPLPECLASIIAGLALGLMSLKTKSVWLGAALHISVAWGMDFACLHRRGIV